MSAAADQEVRLVFLAEPGQAVRGQDQVTAGTRRLSAAERDHSRASQQVEQQSRRTRGELVQVEREIGKTARGALAGAGAFRSFGRSVAFASGYFLGGYGLATALRASVDEMRAASQNAAITRAEIHATGGVAGVTAKEINVLARAIMLKTGIDKQQITTAEDALLKYTEVRNEVGRGNDVYTRAIRLSADLAKANRTDVASSARLLGRALDDPLRATRTLTAANIILTKSQREQITAFAQSGEIVKAQQIILDAVASKVGGTAQRSASQLSILRSELLDLSGELAKVLKPSIAEAAAEGDKWVRHLENDAAARKELRDDVTGIAHAIRDMIHVLKLGVDAVGGTKNALELLVGLKVSFWLRGLLAPLAEVIGSAGAAGAAAEGAATGTGLAGAAAVARALFGSLTKLKGIGAITIPLTLLLSTKLGRSVANEDAGILQRFGSFLIHGDVTKGSDWGMFGKLFTDLLLGTSYSKPGSRAGLPAKTVPNPATTAVTQGKGVQIPTSFVPTHQTAGLPGFPAVDIMAKPGTPIRAPEDGSITRVSGREPSEAPPQGQGGPWGLSLYYVGSDTGNTYYMTHLMKVGQLGSYRKGDVIGIIGDYPGSSADHVHLGVHRGASAQATLPSSLLNPSDFNLGSTGGGRRGRRRRGGSTQRQQLELALAQAGVTPGAADDRSALQALISFVEARLRTPKLPVTTRISLLQEEAGYQSQLAPLAPKTPSHASKASLITLRNTLEEVAKLVERATKTAAMYSLPGSHPGMLAPGNIDLAHRPLAFNKDGSVSTVKSISISVDGREVLIPTVVNGKVLSNKAAIASYLKTGKNLGTFSNIGAADQYAAALHDQQAGLYGPLGKQLQKINEELSTKFVTPETLARVRIQLGKIADAAKAAIEKAKKEVQARKQGFLDAWATLSSEAMAAFDKETADHVGPTRTLLNQLISEHDKAAIDQAVTDAKKALDDALAGKNTQADSDILSRVRELVGKAALANAIDKAQSQILGVNPQEISGGSLLQQLQDLLQPGSGVDPEAVAAAQRAYEEALYQQKLYYLGLQADAEDAAYDTERSKLRTALEKSLREWGTYYANIGKGAGDAAALFQQIWDATLARYPFFSGGTGGGTGQPGGSLPGDPGSLIGPGGLGPGGLVGGPGGVYPGPGGIVAAANGFDGMVLRPTMFMAGEGGRGERVRITPMRGGSSSTGGTEHTVVHLSLGAPLDELVEAKVLQLTPQVSLAIGKDANVRARAGRH